MAQTYGAAAVELSPEGKSLPVLLGVEARTRGAWDENEAPKRGRQPPPSELEGAVEEYLPQELLDAGFVVRRTFVHELAKRPGFLEPFDRRRRAQSAAPRLHSPVAPCTPRQRPGVQPSAAVTSGVPAQCNFDIAQQETTVYYEAQQFYEPAMFMEHPSPDYYPFMPMPLSDPWGWMNLDFAACGYDYCMDQACQPVPLAPLLDADCRDGSGRPPRSVGAPSGPSPVRPVVSLEHALADYVIGAKPNRQLAAPPTLPSPPQIFTQQEGCETASTADSEVSTHHIDSPVGRASCGSGSATDHATSSRPLSPAPAPHELPSAGSSQHPAECKPCAFLHTKGCENGLRCNFCHLCGPGEKKRRQREKQEKMKGAPAAEVEVRTASCVGSSSVRESHPHRRGPRRTRGFNQVAAPRQDV